MLCRCSEGSAGQSWRPQALNPGSGVRGRAWWALGAAVSPVRLQPLHRKHLRHSLLTGRHSCGSSLSPEPHGSSGRGLLSAPWPRSQCGNMMISEYRPTGYIYSSLLLSLHRQIRFLQLQTVFYTHPFTPHFP